MFKLLVLLVASLLLAGCASPFQVQASPSPSAGVGDLKAQKGDLVSVDYAGTLDDGTVFDTSIRKEAEKAGLPPRDSYEPLQFTVGAGQMIKGFDGGVVGMKIGETKTVKLNPSEAYGEKRQDLIIDLNRSELQGGGEMRVGAKLQSSNGAVATVINVSNDTITIDANHPLAGKTLTFKITMRGIKRK